MSVRRHSAKSSWCDYRKITASEHLLTPTWYAANPTYRYLRPPPPLLRHPLDLFFRGVNVPAALTILPPSPPIYTFKSTWHTRSRPLRLPPPPQITASLDSATISSRMRRSNMKPTYYLHKLNYKPILFCHSSSTSLVLRPLYATGAGELKFFQPRWSMTLSPVIPPPSAQPPGLCAFWKDLLMHG